MLIVMKGIFLTENIKNIVLIVKKEELGDLKIKNDKKMDYERKYESN